MLKTLKINLSLFMRYFVCLIMVFLVHISFITIFTIASTKDIGYDVYAVNSETGRQEKLYTHYYADGEDARLEELEDSDTEFSTIVIRSAFEGAPYTACMIISQIFSLLIFILIVPSKLYKFGDSDANKVSFGRETEDLTRGLKYGIGPVIANLASYVVLILTKLGVIGDVGLSVFKLSNYHLFGYLQLVFGKSTTIDAVGWGAIVLALLPLVLTAVSCALSYIFGYKRINLYDKLVFKNKKQGA